MLRGDGTGSGGVAVAPAAAAAPCAAAPTRPASPRSPGSATLFSYSLPPLSVAVASGTAAVATHG